LKIFNYVVITWKYSKLGTAKCRYIEVTFDLRYITLGAVAYRGGFGDLNVPPPKFRTFDKVEPDCKLSGKCLVFLFQNPN